MQCYIGARDIRGLLVLTIGKEYHCILLWCRFIVSKVIGAECLVGLVRMLMSSAVGARIEVQDHQCVEHHV